ncbi:MAG: MBL fold metallo-hydrolase, partial [Candidatus Omnitrophota bacterium]
FHLADKKRYELQCIVNSFKEMEIKKTGPCHCSGPEAVKLFKRNYGNNFVDIKLGDIIEV